MTINIVTTWAVLDNCRELETMLNEDPYPIEEIRQVLEWLGELLDISAPRVLDALQRHGDLCSWRVHAAKLLDEYEHRLTQPG
jgi:predicted nucleic acid-binding protein